MRKSENVFRSAHQARDFSTCASGTMGYVHFRLCSRLFRGCDLPRSLTHHWHPAGRIHPINCIYFNPLSLASYIAEKLLPDDVTPLQHKASRCSIPRWQGVEQAPPPRPKTDPQCTMVGSGSCSRLLNKNTRKPSRLEPDIRYSRTPLLLLLTATPSPITGQPFRSFFPDLFTPRNRVVRSRELPRE